MIKESLLKEASESVKKTIEQLTVSLTDVVAMGHEDWALNYPENTRIQRPYRCNKPNT